jgi:2-polyprenyl-6-methoxyphenol hydroxylase-like FAD-dependent oxidoreductase
VKRVCVVGGSIVGCAAAIGCTRAGHEVTVFERSTSQLETRGQGLVQPIRLMEKLIERDYIDADMPVIRMSRRRWLVRDGDLTMGRLLSEQQFRVAHVNWGTLFKNLRKRIPSEVYRAGRNVASVEETPEGIRVTLNDGSSFEFDVVLAADGNMSTIRAKLFPDAERVDGGHVVWRGWFLESESPLPEVGALDEMNTVGFERGHGNLWLIPSPEGTERGEREVAWNLYGGGIPPDLLRDRGVIRTVPPGSCTPAQIEYLHNLAATQLPPVMGQVVMATCEPMITPIYDVHVPTLVRGRIALLGDAAMVLRPVTGSGATKGLEDAMAIADALASEADLADCLARYDHERWAAADGLVALGKRMGSGLVTEAPDWTELSGAEFDALFTSVIEGRNLYFAPDAE